MLRSTNPYTGRIIKEFEEITDDKIENLIGQSGQAFEKWRKTTFENRKFLMERAAGLIKKNIDEYSSSITLEMGKPIKESKAEVEKCVWVCEYYANNAEQFLRTETIKTDADMSYVHYEPIGTVLGIMPWNFPFWQVFRFAIPTLMAGNTILLKHASNVQICAQHIENLFTRAGFPGSVFRNLVIGSQRVEKVIRNPVVKAVSLTGSETAGQQVASLAGKELKKTLLELGGSNAFIVLEDANINKAVEVGLKARFQNAGQSCIAAKRFIIHEIAEEKFISSFLEEMKKLTPGDPSLECTVLGPLSSVQQAEKVDEQVRKSIGMGAKLVTGGIREGAFYHPTLLTNVLPGMPVFDEEVFGPVVPVITAENTAHAIELANKTNFGLGVSIFTTDLVRARELVTEFKDGSVFINAMVKSDPRLPFGGTGHSGYGRELASHGIKEFVNIKTVYLKT